MTNLKKANFKMLIPDFATDVSAVVAAELALPVDLKDVKSKSAKQASQLQTEKNRHCSTNTIPIAKPG